ncbi:PepSY domain-containing protein [Pacificimonas sp. WHA3]|uniref:PepSY domain-containing protein n=1 Tax=Pacificimonas pallii TaxID=2827236 RepID=A0ABS6SCB9_9SPHN|nr:PepSY domain-containing protein [Pacificimonas pallii]MBV7256062.1 PepSY domain-containing protein [Pacificimonas pallii]
MKLHPAVSKLHKWLALIVGVQMMLWMLSGLFMTVFPIENVRGEHLIREATRMQLEAPLVMPDFDGEPVTGLSLSMIGGRPALVVAHPARRSIYDPYTGDPVPAPTRDDIVHLADAGYSGSAAIREVRLIESDPPGEYRGALPVWQVTFDGFDNLRLYFDPDTGELLTRRTRLWRIFDFMWMLHIMDYESRENFNNPLVQVAAGLGLSVALSGLLLVIYRTVKPWWRRRLRQAH